MKFYSFFKVGGGFRSEDYDKILHLTAGKWVDWNAKDTNKESSTKYIDLGGADGQLERPDVWIKPTDSFVVQVKAASVGSTTSFKTGYTLRFPRFQRLRMDKNWESALSIDDFIDLKAKAEAESKDKEMKVDGSRKKISKRLKKELSIAGSDGKVKTRYGGPRTKVLEGFNFCVLSEMLHPIKKSKAEVEDMIKSNGGSIFQSPTARDDICCVAEKKVVKVASLMKSGQLNVVKPAWILDVLSQADIDGPGKDKFLLPFEPSHMFYMRSDDKERIEGNVDMYGDSYTRDVSVDELKKVLDDMVPVKNSTFSPTGFLSQLEEHGKGLGEMRGTLFRNCVVYFAPSANIFENLDADLERRAAKIRFAFAAGKVAQSLEEEITHVVVTDREREHVKALREKIAGIGGKIPRMVGWNWLLDSWIEGTLLDEERYAIVV
jgi:DNA ligase-4